MGILMSRKPLSLSNTSLFSSKGITAILMSHMPIGFSLSKSAVKSSETLILCKSVNFNAESVSGYSATCENAGILVSVLFL